MHVTYDYFNFLSRNFDLVAHDFDILYYVIMQVIFALILAYVITLILYLIILAFCIQS